MAAIVMLIAVMAVLFAISTVALFSDDEVEACQLLQFISAVAFIVGTTILLTANYLGGAA